MIFLIPFLPGMFKVMLHFLLPSRIVVVHFEAEWAEECTVMNEVFKELAKTYKHTVFLRVSIYIFFSSFL